MNIGVSTCALAKLASSSESTGTMFRVMLFLIGSVDDSKTVWATQEQISRVIGCSRESVSKAVSGLRKMGIIRTGKGVIRFADGIVATENEIEVEGCHGWK